jgi:hypothetical protein
MDDDAERGRGRLAGLAREEAVDVVGRRLAVVENCLGGLVRRRHDLKHTQSFVRKKLGRTRVTLRGCRARRSRACVLAFR